MDTTTTVMDGGVMEIPLEQLHVRRNDRTVFTEAQVTELADSLDAVGQVMPIRVQARPDGGWWIVAGERRTRAARQLGWATIQALPAEDDDEASADKMLAENTARVDLNPIDEAEAYRHRIEDLGQTVDHVARVAGRAPSTVEYRLKLLAMAPEVVDLIRAGDMRHSTAECFIGLDHDRQRSILRVANDMTLDALWKLCERLRAEQNQGALFDPGAFALVLDEWVDEAKLENPALTVREMAFVADEVLAGYQALVDDDQLDGEFAAVLARFRRCVEYRLRAAKRAPSWVKPDGEAEVSYHAG